jgi:hypothetical protein
MMTLSLRFNIEIRLFFSRSTELKIYSCESSFAQNQFSLFSCDKISSFVSFALFTSLWKVESELNASLSSSFTLSSEKPITKSAAKFFSLKVQDCQKALAPHMVYVANLKVSRKSRVCGTRKRAGILTPWIDGWFPLAYRIFWREWARARKSYWWYLRSVDHAFTGIYWI